jgi:hypothetical protein
VDNGRVLKRKKSHLGTSMRHTTYSVYFSFFAFLICGCGKAAPPVAPERTSPQSVQFAEVSGTSEGVLFRWFAPTSDVRGKDLKNLQGYRVYRRLVGGDGSRPFELITTVPDQTHKRIEEKIQEAKDNGKRVKRVKLSEQERSVTVLDKEVELGKSYLYKIVPYNHPRIEGSVEKLVRVQFQGEQTQVGQIDNNDFVSVNDLEPTNPELDQSEEVQF